MPVQSRVVTIGKRLDLRAWARGLVRLPSALGRRLLRSLPPALDSATWAADAQPFTLQFVERGLEVEFLSSRAEDLALRLLVVAAIIFVCSVEVLFNGEQLEGVCKPAGAGLAPLVNITDLATSIQAARLAGGRRAMMGTIAVCSSCLILLLRVPGLLGSKNPASCELVAVLAATFLLIALCLAHIFCLDQCRGFTYPVSLFSELGSCGDQAYISDSNLHLSIVAAISCICWILPLRICVLWPAVVSGVAGYALIFAMCGGSEKGRVAGNLIVVAFVGLCALLGKWQAECHERIVFLTEKRRFSMGYGGSFSFEVEPPLLSFCDDVYDSPQFMDDMGHEMDGRADDTHSVTPSLLSVPETTRTGRAFAELDRMDVEPRWKLECIAAIGQKEHWLIDSADLWMIPGRILGWGNFGVVVLANLHGSHVAVKVPRMASSGASAFHLPAIGNELRILRHIRHPNVVLFHGACIDPATSELAIVLEYVRGRSLDKYVEGDPVSRHRHCVLVDICCALRYLHGQRPSVVHGDLKASNILVEDGSSRVQAKLVDFGLSRLLTRKAKPLGGTLTWMAPELIRKPGMPPSPSADVFSFGRLSYFVVTGIHPFSDVESRTLIKLAQKSQTPPLMWPSRAPFLEECQALTNRCVEVEVRSRPSMVGVYSALLSWPQPSEGPCPSHDLLHNQGEPWSVGLQKVRQHLRPVPPGRTQASEPTNDSSGSSGESEQIPRERRPKNRPVPPPRTQGQGLRARQATPALPPVSEGATAEAFSSFGLVKSLSAPGSLSAMLTELDASPVRLPFLARDFQMLRQDSEEARAWQELDLLSPALGSPSKTQKADESVSPCSDPSKTPTTGSKSGVTNLPPFF